MFDNFFDVNFEFCVHLFGAHSRLAWHLLDDVDNFGKNFRFALFHECHEVFDLLLLGLVNDHFISLVHKKIEFLGQLTMIKKSVIDLDKAIILILSFFVLPKELSNVLIALKILGFKFFQPFFSLFDADLLHG